MLIIQRPTVEAVGEEEPTSGRFAVGPLEPGFGYVVHDGEIENPFPDGSPEAAAWAEEHVQFGSEDLFRTSLGLTYDFEGPMEAQLFFEHLSHGQILGEGRNQGVDQIGRGACRRGGERPGGDHGVRGARQPQER